jgi:two-component system, OmpR family, manganese sensing sensor histidine kinase
MGIEARLFRRTRLRLLASFLGILAVVLCIFALGVERFFVHNLYQRFDAQLLSYARTALASVDIENGQFDLHDHPVPIAETQLQWFDATGQLLHQSAPFTTNLGILPQVGRFEALGKNLRAWVEPVQDPPTQQLVGYVRVIRSLEGVEIEHLSLVWGLLGGIPSALFVSAWGGWWLTGLLIRPLEESYARLEQFTGDASHELRNPLMAIATNCAVALKYPEGMRPGDQKKFLLIEDAVRQLLALVQELLMLARADQKPTGISSVELESLVAEVVTGFTATADRQNIRLHYEPSGSADWRVLGKEVQLRALVTNLVDNALKFTPAGGDVWVKLSQQGSSTHLTVEDTGSGIAEQDLPHVFERFWQAEPSRHRRGGTGLGLAIARGIAESHGGILRAESQLARGSRFVLQLPRHQKA